jgi:DNA-binding response OmpR family regulator
MQESYEMILKSSSLLLVEDEISLRDSFSKLLSLYVDKIYHASDGEEAYKIYSSMQPNIIITDVKMPKLNGIDLIKKIRKENQSIPIVITSAYTDSKFLLEAIKLSLVEYVVKPMKESQLNRVLSSIAKNLLENSNIIIKIDEENIYNYNNKQLLFKEKKIDLTHKEVDFIELLLTHKGELVTKHQIEDKLYIYKEAPSSALKNLVFKLRKKLPKNFVKTVRDLGYMID